MGAGRVIAIDHLGYRLAKAATFAHAETYNFTEYDTSWSISRRSPTIAVAPWVLTGSLPYLLAKRIAPRRNRAARL
jgi:hypothetical protein